MHAHAIYHNVTLPSLYSSRIYSSHIIIRTFVYIYIYIVFCKCARTQRDKSTQTLLLLQLWQHVLHAFGMQSKHFQTFEHVAPYPITQATENIYACKVLPLLISSYIRKFIIIW